MKIYTFELFWDLFYRYNISLRGDFNKESFKMYLLSTQEHNIPLWVNILQVLFQLELS